jgi:LAS superfamily LD-carboxypeptidase LdcB
MRTLEQGMHGQDVRAWQLFLIQKGFLGEGNVTGNFLKKTHAATTAFQSHNPPLVVDGVVGPATQQVAKAQGFIDPDTLEFPDIPQKANSIGRLATVHPLLAQRIAHMATVLANRDPAIRIKVESGLRTFAEQQKLYDQGRTTPGSIVTNAKPGESYHNYGLAVDVVPLLGNGDNWNTSEATWQLVGQAGKDVKLEWGGNWTSFVDRPHFQLTGGLKISQCLTLYKSNHQTLTQLWNTVTTHVNAPTIAPLRGDEVE